MISTSGTSHELVGAKSSRWHGWHDWQREASLVLVALAAVTCLFYYEVIFLGRTLVPLHTAGVMGLQEPYGFTGELRPDPFRVDVGASAWQTDPWARKVSREYASGRFPLWNEHQGFGAPLLANAISGGLDPLRLPALLSGSALAWDIYYLIRVMLGGIATYLFARSLGLVAPARFFLAVAFSFQGHFLMLGNNPWVEAYLLLPVILLGTELTMTGRRLRLGFAVTAAAVALDILAGMPEVTLFVLLIAAAYGSYRLIGLLGESEAHRFWVTRAAYLIGAWLIGIALAAPLLLPLLEFVAQASTRASERIHLGLTHEALQNFVIWFIPHLNGLPTAPTARNSIVTYVGATVLMLAIYGLYPARDRIYRLIVPFAVLATIVLMAKTFGMPGVNEIGRLPGLNVSIFQKWSAPVTGFCLALLASVGLHRLLTETPRVSMGALAFVSFSWLSMLGLLTNWDKIIHAPAEHLLASVGVAFIYATAAFAVVQVRHRLPSRLVGIACCGLVTLELFTYAPRNVYQDRYNPYVEPSYVEFLQSRAREERFRIFALDGIMFPNSAAVFELDDIRALDALYINRYRTYIQNFISPKVTDRFVGGPYSSSEQETPVAGNPWFDLAGVRYVITRSGLGVSDVLNGNMLREIVNEGGTCPPRIPPCVAVEPLTIGGITKPWLFEHPPASVRYPVRITAERVRLTFSLALKPDVWDPTKGNGVGFEIAIESNGKRETLYRREIDPKNDPSQRRWIEDAVDLSRFIGQDVVLIMNTDPLRNADYDWAGWGDIRLTPISGGVDEQYTTVYDAEVQILENHHALPRAFLVDTVVPVAGVDEAIATMKQDGIDPAHTAVVEGTTPAQAALVRHGAGVATIRRYSATEITLDVHANEPSFLVLTDSYYPGWKATLDGEEVPIYATDVAFRGIFVPAGQHIVEFSYRPISFWSGVAIAMIGLAALVLILARRAVYRRLVRYVPKRSM